MSLPPSSCSTSLAGSPTPHRGQLLSEALPPPHSETSPHNSHLLTLTPHFPAITLHLASQRAAAVRGCATTSLRDLTSQISPPHTLMQFVMSHAYFQHWARLNDNKQTSASSSPTVIPRLNLVSRVSTIRQVTLHTLVYVICGVVTNKSLLSFSRMHL